MIDYLVKPLEEFGLSEKEAKIYLALLKLGRTTVTEVSKFSSVNRSSAYVVLDALRKKDLVKVSDAENIRKYVAASPEILLYYAKATAKKHEYISSGIENILPELKSLQKK